ncbi:MAG: LacI family DNA-binding transcriptional regulator [Chloroflexota bacterium]
MIKKPTLRDIAEGADVALSTVSQVLNNKPGVSPEMRHRVLATAAELGYRSRVSSESPLSAKLKTIGLLTKRRNGDALTINPFYSHIIAGAESECGRHNISLMYANIEVDEHNHAVNLPSMLLEERVDGVIVLGAFLEETLGHISTRANQIVLVDAYTNDGDEFDRVLVDNVSGAAKAVKHLIASGHRYIGLIGSEPDSYPSIMERRQGYLAALAQYDLKPFIEDSALDRPEAYEATKRLIARVPQITAILACNDNVAIGVINAVQDEGLQVPNHISVIGFDNIDLARELKPALTTLHVDKVLMGVVAVRHLMDRAIDPNRAALKTLVSTQLIERETVRKISV